MDKEVIIEELKSIVLDFLKIRGFELFELIYRYEGKDLFLRFLVDKPGGGIRLDEAAGINRDLSLILDEKDILQTRYVLEVSSPGVDRPLKTKNDFARCINREVRVFLNETINGKWELEGTINKVEDDTVYIDMEGSIIGIPISEISRAKQILNEA